MIFKRLSMLSNLGAFDHGMSDSELDTHSKYNTVFHEDLVVKIFGLSRKAFISSKMNIH